MKDNDIQLIISSMNDIGNNAIDKLQKKADALMQIIREEVDDLLESNGRKRCARCDGHGAIGRLDSGVMKRFGLREWNGCPDCGGEGDKKGLGFVPAVQESGDVP